MPPEIIITNPQDGQTIDSHATMVTGFVENKGGGVDEIRLYNNGKLINQKTRGFKQINNSGDTVAYSFQVIVSNGENHIKVIAISNQRIESNPFEITIVKPARNIKPDLYLFCVGINNYKNPAYRLNYAVADAQGIMDQITLGASDLFGSINPFFIVDDQATKTEISDHFRQLKTTINPNDVFIFYFAGHGVMSEEDASQYYIIPYDVVQLYGNNQMLKEKGISANEIQQFSRELPAQKQLYILDACQSGGMVEHLATRGLIEEKAIAQLARSTGTFWMTASGKEQLATEFDELGHGLFTYSILLGLQGGADGKNKDRKITVLELNSFLNDMVPELTQKYKGMSQYPRNFGYGQDFPVVITIE